jgi:hypothetical protein
MESVFHDSEKFYQDDKYTDLVLIITLNLVWPLNCFISRRFFLRDTAVFYFCGYFRVDTLSYIVFLYYKDFLICTSYKVIREWNGNPTSSLHL